MPGVAAVIDLGGDDVYYDGTVSPDRPVLLVIDLAGNDMYRSTKPGVQGAAILGVSMLLDLEGNDVFQAEDVAQGSCLAGVGILIHYSGNDRCRGFRPRARIGAGRRRRLHRPRRQRRLSRGDVGARARRAAGLRIDGEHPRPQSLLLRRHVPRLVQAGNARLRGLGPGSRRRHSPIGNGGVGVILNGGGGNVYEFDYLSHGGGYWCGLGFARDFRGNNKCLICRKNYYGGQRSEPLFQRFGCGGLPLRPRFCFDDAGNNVYEGTIMAPAWPGIAPSARCAVSPATTTTKPRAA